MRITTDGETRFVTAAGRTVDAQPLDPDRPCDTCGDVLHYDDAADAVFCPTCNDWRENACSNDECGYCAERPPRPL